jgi:hypothetical protein
MVASTVWCHCLGWYLHVNTLPITASANVRTVKKTNSILMLLRKQFQPHGPLDRASGTSKGLWAIL